MIQIFISHSQDDVACAEQIRRDLEAEGYTIWRDTRNLTPDSISYAGVIENGIRGSAVIVIIWSSSAAQSEWIERQILFAQRLRKPIFCIVIDGTDLPITLVNVQSITSKPPCTDALAHLLPYLPPADSDDTLIVVLQQLTHEYIRVRKSGIDLAVELLEREEHREEVLALLQDIGRKDLIMGVREKALSVLEADTGKDARPPSEDESRHGFGARCSCGHVTYFDKRHVCPDSSTFMRNLVRRADAELDEIYLKCEECKEEIVVRVDCEGYK